MGEPVVRRPSSETGTRNGVKQKTEADPSSIMAENSHLISKMPERETGLPNTYETAGAEGRKQSQSSKEETRRKPRSRDGRPARQSGRRPVASEAEGSELLRAAGVPPLRRSDDLDSPGDGQMKSRTYRGVERANHVSRVPETESGWSLPLRPFRSGIAGSPKHSFS